ncbi:MAG: LysM peptidoglycan-binding domain-containing protein [Akkermansia sp.]|nr:LysM peptidoglycan-binding domain-containing protein [Akkermansia sp.]MBR2313865.1 LysM peptidoglycan-binding domain-containing protein [Akkermansia sp.]
MNHLSLPLRFALATAAAIGLSSCAIKNGRLDFTWWADAAAPVREDDVVIENGSGGYYNTRPVPNVVPAASQPLDEPEIKPHLAPRLPVLATNTPGMHIVQRGDTLSALARRYNTTVPALVAANGMPNASTPLRINQQLILPVPNAAAPAPAQPVAARPAAPAPARPAAPATAGGTYTVQAGDTLYRISRQHGIAPAALMKANGFTPETANLIRVGTTLRIPAAN